MNPLPNPIPTSRLVRAFVQQLLAVVALYLTGLWIWGPNVLGDFVLKSGRDWAQLEGVMLAAALVVWGMYVNFTVSGFGDYLRWSRREFSYRVAFTTALFSPLLAAILLIIATNTPRGLVHQAALLALLYSLLEVYGTYRNIVSLSERKREFEVALAADCADSPSLEKSGKDGSAR